MQRVLRCIQSELALTAQVIFTVALVLCLGFSLSLWHGHTAMASGTSPLEPAGINILENREVLRQAMLRQYGVELTAVADQAASDSACQLKQGDSPFSFAVGKRPDGQVVCTSIVELTLTGGNSICAIAFSNRPEAIVITRDGTVVCAAKGTGA